ncbi:MAG: DUF3850 domain-containing protein [Candidatus Micrarchaeota archaeon]|nr:DUF3850 domain-containing protein [Candidatus Micrarchaeota archaeon]MDE1848074.1 DUF3850 domain-containing protein [Candidatus Micrarchaeota archaeon]MDE1864871.1 DUF3850 domain-containing protein [Candidatus Micrarchaeota archaeon]
MRIEKKVWPEYFKKLVSGEKGFEIRLADFKCKPGDTLILREWDPKTGDYTGRSAQRRVKYVAMIRGMDFWKREEVEKYGLQVIGF